MQSVSRVREAPVSPTPMRCAVRFPLHLSVRVQTVDGPVDAETKDISSTGVLFIMPFAPAVNTRLTWIFLLPGDKFGSPRDISVVCAGRVVWHSPCATGRQVGVVIDEYRLEEKHA